MARRSRSKRIFWFALMVIGSSVCAGGVAAWVTHFNVGRQNDSASAVTTPTAASDPVPAIPAINPSGLTPNARNLAALPRPQLEAEVTRLNQTLTERNQQIDDLKIQLKLASEGSRSQP